MEEANKYWSSEEDRMCRFCKVGRDNLEHYVRECTELGGWFDKLGNSTEERLKNIGSDELGTEKGRILKRLRTEKKKYKKCM